jgi:hypothetical protein
MLKKVSWNQRTTPPQAEEPGSGAAAEGRSALASARKARCFKLFGDGARPFLAPPRKARYHGPQTRPPSARMEETCVKRAERAEISRRYKRSGGLPPGGVARPGRGVGKGEIAWASRTSDPRSSRSRSRSILHEPLFAGGAATGPSLRAAIPTRELSIAINEGHDVVESARPRGSDARGAPVSCRACRISRRAAARGCARAARTYAHGN